MLARRGGQELQLADAALWAAAWGLGAAVGVMLGAWLTAVGAAAPPGENAIDIVSDLLVLPAVAFVGVGLASFGIQVIVAALRGRAVERRHEQHEQPGG